jgi:hypothetical protein
MSGMKTKVGAGVTLAALGGLAAYAVSAGNAQPSGATTAAAKTRPVEVRTVTIHRTVRVVKHEKPRHAKRVRRVSSAAAPAAPASPVVRSGPVSVPAAAPAAAPAPVSAPVRHSAPARPQHAPAAPHHSSDDNGGDDNGGDNGGGGNPGGGDE